MAKPHVPTLLAAALVILIALGIYHLAGGRRLARRK